MKPIIWKYGPLEIRQEPYIDESTKVQQFRDIRKNYSKFISKIPIDNDFDTTFAHTYTKNLIESYLQEFDRDHFSARDKMSIKSHISFLSKILKKSQKMSSFTLICFETLIENIELLKYAFKALKHVKKLKIHFFLLSDQKVMQFWVKFVSKILKYYKLTHLSFDIFINPLVIPNLMKLLQVLSRIRTLESLEIDLFSTSTPHECAQFPQVLDKISSLLQKNNQFKHFSLNIPGSLDKYENELVNLWSSLKNQSEIQNLKMTICLENERIKEKIQTTLHSLSNLSFLDINLKFCKGIAQDLTHFFQSLPPTLKALQITLTNKSSDPPPTYGDLQSLGQGISSLKSLEELIYNYHSERSDKDYLQVLGENIGSLGRLRRLEFGADGETHASKSKMDLFNSLTKVIKNVSDLCELGFEFQIRDSAKRFQDESFWLFLEEVKRFTGLTSLKLNFGETSCGDKAFEGLKDVFKYLNNLKTLEIDIGSRKFTNKGLIDFGKGVEAFEGSLERLRFSLGGGKIRKGVKRLLQNFVRVFKTREVEITFEVCGEGIEDTYDDIFVILNESIYSKFWKLEIFDF